MKPTGAGKQLQTLPGSEVKALMELLQRKEFGQLEKKSRKLIKKFPRATLAYNLLSAAQMNQGNFRATVKTLAAAVAIDPGFADGWYNFGVAHFNLGNNGDAVECLERSIALNPSVADAWNNLGLARFANGEHETALAAYDKAMELDPKNISSRFNKANALQEMLNSREAEVLLTEVVQSAPDFGEAHLALGISQVSNGKLEDAVRSLTDASKLLSDPSEALYLLGGAHLQYGDTAAAIRVFEQSQTPAARAKLLETMLQTEASPDQLITKLRELEETDPRNLRLSALSNYLAEKFSFQSTNPFCNCPLEFISVRKLLGEQEDTASYMEVLMEFADKETAIWENRTTKGGFQTFGNLFEKGAEFEDLARRISRHLANYQQEHAVRSEGIIKWFPKNYRLNGWRVKLMKSGFQKPHIHPRGWISGVLYLKVPSKISGNEGAIAFGFDGYGDTMSEPEGISRIHNPEVGDLVLFPSSLYHKTVPFDSDEERQCIAFDVVPV